MAVRTAYLARAQELVKQAELSIDRRSAPEVAYGHALATLAIAYMALSEYGWLDEGEAADAYHSELAGSPLHNH